jgi:multiple sugar transport system ATP-binding protein
MTMGDRVALLKDGLLQQVDSPRNLYDRPGNVFVAGFIGSPAMNIVDVDLTEEGARVGDFTVPIPRDARTELSSQGAKRATLGFRPEGITVVGEGEGLPFDVLVVEELGSDAYAYGSLHLGPDANVADDKMFIARVDARRPPRKGETIHLKIRENEEHVFNSETGLRIGGATSGFRAGNSSSDAGAHRG